MCKYDILKDIIFGFGDKENEVTPCEGILKPYFYPQPYRSPGLSGQHLVISDWLQAQQCKEPRQRQAPLPPLALLS